MCSSLLAAWVESYPTARVEERLSARWSVRTPPFSTANSTLPAPASMSTTRASTTSAASSSRERERTPVAAVELGPGNADADRCDQARCPLDQRRLQLRLYLRHRR